jgi:hypothetical protein
MDPTELRIIASVQSGAWEDWGRREVGTGFVAVDQTSNTSLKAGGKGAKLVEWHHFHEGVILVYRKAQRRRLTNGEKHTIQASHALVDTNRGR